MLACFLLFVSQSHGETGLSRISDHVYSYVDVKDASAANSFGANAGIVIGEKGILVVDTLVSAREAKRFIRDIREVSDKPITFVVNTHSHLDHSFGNSEFAGIGAHLIAQSDGSQLMHKNAENTLTNAVLFGLSREDMAGTTIVYPDITFQQRLDIDLGDLKVELIHLHPSHSPGSLLVHIPAENIVFAGDVLFSDFHPYMADGDLEGWLETLDFLQTLEAKQIIPGHGPLSGSGEVEAMKDYLTRFDQYARKLARGSTDMAGVVTELREMLPPRSQGEWLIEANMEAKYFPTAEAKKTAGKGKMTKERQ